MKKVLGSLVLAFTLLVSSQVFADPSAQSMSAIKAQDWQKAENSLSQDLKSDRKDPLTWYFRAMVLNHLQRPDDALKCLDNVVKLDASFRPGKVSELRQRLERNSQILAKSKSTGKPVVTASSIENKQRDTQVVKQTPVSAPPVPNSTRYTDTTVSKPTPTVASTQNQEKSSGGFFAFLLTLVLLGGVGFFGYSFFSRKSTDKAKAQFQSDMIVKLVDADKKLSNMKEMLELNNKESSYLFKRIGSLKDEVIIHTRAVKAGKGYNGYEIEKTLNEVDEAELRYSRKEYDAPVSEAPAPRQEASTYSQPRETAQPSPRRETESYSAPRSTPRSHSQPRSAPSHSDRGHTTIINNGSNGNDLLTTMAGAVLVNEMINHHEPVREREVVREVPVYEDRPEKDDFSFGSSSNNYDDSSKSDDFSLNDSSDYDNDSRSDDFSSSSSSSDSYNDSSSDDDFNL